MSFDLGNDTIIRVRAPLVRSPRDNSESRDWAHASRLAVSNCKVEPFLASNRLLVEVNAGREFQQEPFRVYAPPDSDWAYTDRVEWLGKSYDITAEPAGWTNLDGELEFWAFVMRIREG